jgi:hypothetical protein|tara:strand:+ start:41 stop:478 length:438 start_codon:yes stop_codon:yes gene_type:complete
MISLLTNLAPILFGFVAKIIAVKAQAASDNQKLMIENMNARNDSINQAREAEKTEGVGARLNRRVIIFVILSLIIFTQVAPVFFNVPTVVPTVIEGISILGLQFTRDTIEYVTVEAGAVLKLNEVFSWATTIIEVYFGAQLGKGK